MLNSLCYNFIYLFFHIFIGYLCKDKDGGDIIDRGECEKEKNCQFIKKNKDKSEKCYVNGNTIVCKNILGRKA